MTEDPRYTEVRTCVVRKFKDGTFSIHWWSEGGVDGPGLTGAIDTTNNRNHVQAKEVRTVMEYFIGEEIRQGYTEKGIVDLGENGHN